MCVCVCVCNYQQLLLKFMLASDICQVIENSRELWRSSIFHSIYVYTILYLLQTILGWSTFEHITDCNRGIPVRKVGIITSTGNGNAKPIAGHSSHRNCVILPCGAIALQIGSSKGIVIMCISMCVCMNAKEN